MAVRKETKKVDPEILMLYEKLVQTNTTVERKGATIPYTSLNGHMFSYINDGREVALRLPVEAREEFLKKYKSKLVKSFGMVMKEYVSVPRKLLDNTKELKKYFDQSYEYVSTLKPKPAKKSKSSKKKK